MNYFGLQLVVRRRRPVIVFVSLNLVIIEIIETKVERITPLIYN